MKIYSEEISSSGKKRILFACGLEDIKILQALVLNAKKNTPRIKTEENNTLDLLSRLQSMSKEFIYFINDKEPKQGSKKDTQCPYCDRQVRGPKALKNHIEIVHSKE